MRNLLIGGTAAVIFIGLLITSVLFHDLYKQEQKKTANYKAEINKMQLLIDANERNKPEELTENATLFIKTMFESSQDAPETHRKALLRMTSGEAYKRLTETEKHEHGEATDDLDGFKSEAHIIDSIYNRINTLEGKIVVEFEHWLTKDGSTSKTVNEAVIELTYKEGEWKIHDYKIVQKI